MARKIRTAALLGAAMIFSAELAGAHAPSPVAGARLYVDPASNALLQARQWQSSRPREAEVMRRIGNQPVAHWFGEWSGDVRGAVNRLVSSAAASGSVPVLVAYNIPQRDCGSYSAGGAHSADGYRSWIRSFANGIGRRSAIVILEPDAVASAECLSSADRARRFELLSAAVNVLKSTTGATVYVDGGHSRWLSVAEAARRLQQAGIGQADGFSLNVSNFQTTESNLAYGQKVSALVGGKHFVIDTSRNGAGATGEWCNPAGRALGYAPTTNTGNALADAYLWIKRPGESDGTCNGGPRAGQWWPDYALRLAQRSPVSLFASN